MNVTFPAEAISIASVSDAEPIAPPSSIISDAEVTPAVVTHGSMTVRVNEDQNVNQNNNIAMNSDQVVVTPGDATVTPDTEIDVDEEVAKAFIFDPGVELSEIVESINAVGASASDLVAILEALREAGSLRAELIII